MNDYSLPKKGKACESRLSAEARLLREEVEHLREMEQTVLKTEQLQSAGILGEYFRDFCDFPIFMNIGRKFQKVNLLCFG